MTHWLARVAILALVLLATSSDLGMYRPDFGDRAWAACLYAAVIAAVLRRVS